MSDQAVVVSDLRGLYAEALLRECETRRKLTEAVALLRALTSTPPPSRLLMLLQDVDAFLDTVKEADQ